jgi:asparagine synthase (glutamine-hydrolysing)
MCGICGELRFDGLPADLSAVERMSEKIARRGPDHAGVFSDGPLAFGHRRLAVIDLSADADQPMVDQDLKLVLVFNGTIYNYKELRAELLGLGYRFFSDSDSEVILKAHHAWGAGCVRRFLGMFAFAAWDLRDASLFMARDRFGIKPLYYTLDGSGLRFASSLQVLLAAGEVDASIDPVALHHHFTLHAVVPAPRTILKGVRKLAPATTMMVRSSHQIEETIYRTLDATRPPQPLSESQWLAATREVLVRDVERHRLAADMPVGVLLSAGLEPGHRRRLPVVANSAVALLQQWPNHARPHSTQTDHSDLHLHLPVHPVPCRAGGEWPATGMLFPAFQCCIDLTMPSGRL